MEEGINVLSLFDGISCGQIALERAGVKVRQYFASEVDKHAIRVTQHHYPKTIQLGDVTKVFAKDLPKIDLLIGGSPCQSFSYAGKGKGFVGQSGLFFEWLRLFKEVAPEFFLLENVLMRAAWKNEISRLVGVEPTFIDSAGFSAQSRKRLYWTNILVDTAPNNEIYLQDVLDQYIEDGYFLTNRYKLKTLLSDKSRLTILFENYRVGHKQRQPKPVLVSEVVGDTPSGRSRQTDRLYSSLSKSPTLLANRACDLKIDCGSNDSSRWRTLTPIECERLQTIPDNYTICIADNQRYKCLGNGWTVDVIAHIFRSLPYAPR